MSKLGKLLLALCVLACGAPAVHALQPQPLSQLSAANLPLFHRSAFVMSMSGGVSWESAGTTQTLNLTPTITKTYDANKSATTLANGELFLGYQKPLSSRLLGQLGVELADTGNAILSGDIWDDGNPLFNNYNYKYQIQHRHVALKGKLLGDWNLPVLPWLSAGLGWGINFSHNFTSVPTIAEAVPTPDFKNNTTNTFTYNLGIGAQWPFAKNWQIGLGFEFADWGKSQLGTAIVETTNQNLSLTHLYTKSVLFNLTYLA